MITSLKQNFQAGARGVILSGGPRSVTDSDAPKIPAFLLSINLPILGICYGLQALCYELGGEVNPATERGYGSSELDIIQSCALCHDVWKAEDHPKVWLSHGDRVTKLPAGFTVIAQSRSTPFAIVADEARSIYGVQFHPEVAHTADGLKILKNFTHVICGCSGNWSMRNFCNQAISAIRNQVGNRRVLCALSGGVDSAVTAALLAAAVPKQVKCIMVDTGLLRKNEAAYIAQIFSTHFGTELNIAYEEDRFFAALAGHDEPEAKRKIIGHKIYRSF